MLAKDEEGRTALQLLENMEEDEEDETNENTKLAIKHALKEAVKNPRKPSAAKRVDSSDLFTTGANFTTSTQLSSRSQQEPLPSRRDSLERSRHSRASDGAISNRTSKLSRGPAKQRYSEPLKRTNQPAVDEWLVKDHSSPKRKQPHDPFFPKPSENKRSKQSKLPTRVVLHDEDSPDPPTPAVVVIKTERTANVSEKILLRVKIRIRDVLFLIPVQSTHTISDLADMASQRYKDAVGLLPKLSLTTSDGALLNSEDVASHLLADRDELVGVIEESLQDSLVDKYTNTCQRLGLDPIFKENLVNSTNSLSICRAVASPKHLECFFTTILCTANITSLDVSYNSLARDVLSSLTSALPTLTSLSCLNLGGCGINSDAFPKISDALSNLPLQTLRLDFNSLTTSFVQLLELAVTLPELLALSAKNCSLESATALPSELSVKFTNSKLITLDLSQNPLTHFPELPKNLNTLFLGGSDVFSTSLNLPESLESLSLDHCNLNNTILELLSGLRRLTSFSAPRNNITAEGVVDLLMLFPTLTFLDLSGNPLGSSGIEELGLVAPPNLTVKLQNCGAADLTHDIIATLAESFLSCDISYNRVNYPRISKELSEETRCGVLCQGNKLVVKSVKGS